MRLTHFLCQAGYASGAFALAGVAPILGGMSYTQFLRQFGAAVRARRLALDKTQPEIADAVDGLDQGGLSRVERGGQGFDSDTLYQLALALDVPVHRLFGGADPTASAQPSPEALDIARQWDALTASGRLRFQAAMILAMEPASDERVRGAGYVPQDTTEARGAKAGKRKKSKDGES